MGRRPNYSYEKLQRELKKQKKKERKLAKKGQSTGSGDDARGGAPANESSSDDEV